MSVLARVVLPVRASAAARGRIGWRQLAEVRREGIARVIGIAALAVGIGAAIFAVCYFGGQYLVFRRAPELVRGGVAVSLLGTMSALFLSSLGHAANAFFVARDLWFLDAAPISALGRFIDRARVTGRAALPAMLVLGGLALMGLLLGNERGVLVIGRALIALFAIALLPLSLGIFLAHLGGALLPAGKLRRVSLLGVALGLVGGLAWFRSLRVEDAVTEAGAQRLLEEAEGFSRIGPSFLPHNLGVKFVMGADLSAGLALFTTSFAFIAAAYLSHRFLYRRCRDLASDDSPRGFDRDSTRARAVRALAARFGGDLAPVVEKDLLAFLRDPAQWSQLVLLSGIAVLYLINADALSAGFARFGNFGVVLIVGLHTGLSTFIAAGLSARFAFPQLGLEGPAVWMLEAAPIDTSRVVKSKAAVALPMVAGFPTVVGVLGGFVLGLPLPVWFGSTVVICLVSISLAAYGAGRGAVTPLFDATTVSEHAMGPGALSTMFTSLALSAFAGATSSIAAAVWLFVGGAAGASLTLLACAAPVAVSFLFAYYAVRRGARALVERKA